MIIESLETVMPSLATKMASPFIEDPVRAATIIQVYEIAEYARNDMPPY